MKRPEDLSNHSSAFQLQMFNPRVLGPVEFFMFNRKI
ncbi:hypothetical protein ABAC460_07595 [Asticcacaulis sp. AC460]|nr:hypothetical protein ABAC460_07595 [Asticcacaulis sp. AC460]